MVYPHEHILIRYQGHFGANASTVSDKWSCGMRFGLSTSAPAYDAAKLQTFVNACNVAASVYHASAGSMTGTNTFLDYTTGAQIGVLGNYQPTTQLTVTSPVSPTTGVGTPVMPWNTALVFSLRTAIPRGRASNGRIYWPAIAASVTNTSGRVPTASVVSRLGQFKIFCDAVNTAANAYSAGMRLLVASAVGGGIHAPVTAVRSDERLDSIERRENQQPAVYSSVTLA